MAFITCLPLCHRPSLPHRHRSHHRSYRTPHVTRRPRFCRPRMALSAAFASSDNPDTAAAISTVVSSASATCPTPTVAIVSTTIDRPLSHVHATLQSLLPGVAIHGCTTCNALLTTSGALQNGVGVLLLQAEQLTTASAVVDDNTTPVDAAASVADTITKALPQVANILISSSPGIEEPLIAALSSHFPSAAIFGGSAADNTVEGKWGIYTTDGVITSGVSVLAMGASVKFGSCLLPPYAPTSQAATVTKANGRLLEELDGRPAAEVLLEWRGDCIATQAKEGGNVIVEMASFPLGVKRGDAYIGIHAANITDGKVGLFAEIQQGDVVVRMQNIGDSDSATAASIGLSEAYQGAMKNGKIDAPKAGVMIYCGGLSIAVGDELGKSLESVKNCVPMLGVTAFGEQGFLGGANRHCNLAVGVALFE